MATLQNRNGNYRVLFLYQHRRETLPAREGLEDVSRGESRQDRRVTLPAQSRVSDAARQGFRSPSSSGMTGSPLPHPSHPPPRPHRRSPSRTSATNTSRPTAGSLEANTLAGMEICCVSDLTYEVAARPIHYRQYELPCAPIKGSVKCHANSIPAALSKLSCSPGWRCFSYLPPSYPPDTKAWKRTWLGRAWRST